MARKIEKKEMHTNLERKNIRSSAFNTMNYSVNRNTS